VSKWLDAVKFQESLAAELARQPFEQLAARPPHEEVQMPPELDGIRCFIERRAGDAGEVEITVGIEKRYFFVLRTSYVSAFEKFPDGRWNEL
jgi:hypothetical protein